MNTNIQVSLNDEQRDHIANLYHNKVSAKLATRKEVSELVQMFVAELVASDLTEPKEIAKTVISNLDGYKFHVKEAEVDINEFLDFSCDDCGCMVSVSETRLKALKPDETGLGQFWQDGLPEEVL